MVELAEHPGIGVEHEHQLIGSAAWERQKQYEADRKKGGKYSIHFHIANAIREYCADQEPQEMNETAHEIVSEGTYTVTEIDEEDEKEWVRRRQTRSETATGLQLHHTMVNRLEVGNALATLEKRSATNYRRYLMSVIGGMNDTAIAEDEHESLDAIRMSLSRARTFLARAIRDAVPY